jgi:type I restriction enzyme S subunit
MSMTPYLEYKDSGVEWIEKVPSHWKKLQVKHVFNLGRGRVISTEEVQPEGLYPVYSSQTMNDGCLGYIDSFDFDCDQITWTTDGANAGTIFLRSGKHNCTNVCGTLQPKNNDLSLKYAMYYLSHVTQFYKRPDTNGAKIMNGEMAAILFLLPTDTEQKKIASFLEHEVTKIDSLIAEQEKLIELLKEKRQAAVSHAVTKGIKPNVKMKDSGVEWLGKVPEHWDIMPLKRFFGLIVDLAPDDNDLELLSLYTEIGVKPRKDLEARGNRASTTDGYLKVAKGDIVVNKLLAWMGALGVSEYEGVTSPAYDILRAKRSLSPHYYDHLFRCGILNTEFRRYSRGIMDMRLRLYFEEFGQFPMPFPPQEEQLEIVESLRNRLEQFNTLSNEALKAIELLQERKSALISVAVTGQINVRDVAIETE